MPRHRFTLAALATVAVPGLDVAQARTFTGGGEGDHDSALLTDVAGDHMVIRAPVGADSGRRLDAEVRALAALTGGARARLPFAVPSELGRTAAPHAVVTTYVEGQRLRPATVRPGDGLAGSIGRAIAAIHRLPPGVIVSAGLPVATAAESGRAVGELVDRAERTRAVPVELIDRWGRAAEDRTLWQYRPTVVHGGLAAENVLTSARDDPGADVTGVLGWAGLAIDDPARDLAWCLGLPVPGAAGAVLGAYHGARSAETDPQLQQRALLHAELEIARWLLFGTDAGSAEIVADAGQMLEALAVAVRADTAGSLDRESLPVMTVAEVERMLEARRQSSSIDAHAARSSATE